MNEFLSRGRDAVTALHAEDEATDYFPTLAELKANPALLAPPECVLSRIGYRGRLTIFAGPDKAGKSTLLAEGEAAVSHGGRFLGERVSLRHQRVLHIGLEEAIGDAVRRLTELDAQDDRINILSMADARLLERIDKQLSALPADVVVIDSLQELARVLLGTVPGDGDNAGWAAVMRPLVGMARKHDTAVVLLHHVRKSDGTYRGASEIAAAADALLEMKVEENTNRRSVSGRGRWTVEPFTVELVDGRYQLASTATLSDDSRIILYVEQHRGASKNDVAKAIGGRAEVTKKRIDALIGRGAIKDLSLTKDRMALYPASAQEAA